MNKSYSLKIDIFPHILPTKYKEALYKIAPLDFRMKRSIEMIPTLYDLESRFRIIDKYAGLVQVLNIKPDRCVPGVMT